MDRSSGYILLFILMLIPLSHAVTVPTNIVAYLPITFTNYQSSAVAANTPLAVGTTSSGNIIGFNAVAYQQYEGK